MSPSLHDSPEAKAARAAREERLEKQVGERVKEQNAFNARAGASHPSPVSRAEAGVHVHTFARDNAAASAGTGGHHISMAAAEAAIKKLQAKGVGAHAAHVPHRRAAVEQQAAIDQPSGGHHISMAAAEAAVKKLEAEGK
uniref:SMP domain-containing protein n=2 Tax=Hemiselmis andersenii TaxID=464988 RepID=A0A6U5AFR2_HEMAN